MAIFLVSCIDDSNKTDVVPTTISVSGHVQKGPFINGTSVSISELKKDQTQTGKNYFAQILDNKGSFEINEVAFSSKYVELKADGFYFNEVTNEISSAQLTLYAISDVSNKTTLNVNVLSYLEKSRIQYLISKGMDFEPAKIQAQTEILAIFSINLDDVSDSELLDISKSGEGNAALIAVSVILQGYLTVAELSELLANISSDIREDGILTSELLGSQLMNSAKKLKLSEIRTNLEARYETLGQMVTVADFEKHVTNFIDSSNFEQTEKIEYPATGAYGLNILSTENTDFPTADYSMKAILPIGFSLKVVVKGVDFGSYSQQSENTGWDLDFIGMEGDEFVYSYTSSKSGEIDYKMHSELIISSKPITVTVYENGYIEPTWTKNLTSSTGLDPIIEYPASGAFGLNILSTENTDFPAANYSMKAILPVGVTLKVVIKGNDFGCYYPLVGNTGWSMEFLGKEGDDSVYSYTSTRSDEIDFKMHSELIISSKSITVTVYENGDIAPTWTKNLTSSTGLDPIIEYPASGTFGLNILSNENTDFPSGDYSMKAILPDGFSLKVIMKGNQFWTYFPQFENAGWNYEYLGTEGDKYISSYTSSRSGEIDFKMQSTLTSTSSPVILSIYENGALEPTWPKKLTNGNATGFDIPQSGLYGQNVLALSDSSYISKTSTYSLAVKVPDDKTYDIEIKLHFTQDNLYSIDELQNLNWTIYKSPLELRLTLQGRNIDADLPITFIGTGQLSIEGGVTIYGLSW